MPFWRWNNTNGIQIFFEREKMRLGGGGAGKRGSTCSEITPTLHLQKSFFDF